MADYDTTVGIQLDDDFEKAIVNANRLISALNRVEEATKKFSSTASAINKTVNSMSKLSGLNFSNIDNQIDKLVQSISALETKLSKVNASNLIGIADALRTLMSQNPNFNLSGIEKLKEIPLIMKSIEAIDSAKLGKVFSTLATQIQPFIAKLKEAHTDLQNLATVASSSMGKVSNSVNKAKDKVKQLGTESNNTGKKVNQIFKVGNMIYFFNMSKRLFSGFGNMLNKSIDFAETENLFSVAMRDMRGEATKFQNTMSEAFGLALPDMMKAQGLFKNMLSAIKGLNQETAAGLSETMTKMSVDFASLYNTSIESAMTKMQAALSRQVRPIRSVSGYDITQNVLGESLKQMDIYDRTVAKLSEMEKRLVIIYTLQQQMARSGAMGDFARTIEQPAQQLKVLQQQLSETGRWIGAVFMGTVGKVLPYINAFVMVIKELIKALAMFTGYKVPDSSGVSNILDQMTGGAGDFGDALDTGIENANDGLEKAKKTVDSLLAPFDKLNIIQKPNDDSGKDSSPSTGGIGAIDDRILASLGKYDNMMDNVRMKATAIRDRIMEWLGFTKTIDGLTGETVWKLGEGYTRIEKIRDAIVVAGIALASWKVAKSIFKLFSLGSSTSPLFTGIKGLQNILSAGGITASFGKILAVVSGIAITIAAIAIRLYDLIMNSESFRRGMSAVWDVVKLIGGTIADIFIDAYKGIMKFGNAIGMSNSTTRGLLMDLGAIALLFTPAAPFAAAYLIFDVITKAIEGVGYAMSPCIEQFDNLTGASAQTKTNLEPMLDTMDDMETNLKQMDWTNLAPDAESVAKANESVNKFSNDLITHLENSKKKAIDTMNDLFVKSSFSQEEQNQMISGVNATYNNISGKVREAQKTITDIYNKANSENRALSNEEVKTIQANQDWLKEQSVITLSASEKEQNTILNNMKANAKALSVEQASDIIKNSIETRNQTRAEAESRYQEQLAIAQKLKQDGGAENEALATKIIEEAERQKKESVAKADEMHTNIIQGFKDQNPKVAKYLDEGTGNIKSNLDIWIEEFDNWCTDTGKSISDWFKNKICPWFTVEKWKELGEKMKQGIIGKFNEFVSWWDNLGFVVWWRKSVEPWFSYEKWVSLGSGIKDGLVQAFKNAVNGGIGIFNGFIKWINEKMHFSWDGIKILGKQIVPSGNVQLFRIPLIPQFYNGGFVGKNVGQLFAANEPGNPELVGNIGGRTAVVNNKMILEGLRESIRQGVIEGMLQIQMQSKDDGTTIVYVYLGDELIETQIIKANEKHERKTGKPVFSR